MTKIKGQLIVETIDVADADVMDMRSLERQVDIGYRRFLMRRGLPLPFGMKESVDAGFQEALSEKKARRGH